MEIKQIILTTEERKELKQFSTKGIHSVIRYNIFRK